MQAKRGATPGRDVAIEIGIDPAVFYRLETGKRGPSAQTARALARWLGWTTDQVLDAAEQTAGGSDGQERWDATLTTPERPDPLARVRPLARLAPQHRPCSRRQT